jgi:glucose 1-dehydrogenase
VALWDVADGRRPALAAELRPGCAGAVLPLQRGRKAEVDAALAATLARFGRVDGLVNNAGIFKAATSWTSPKPTGTR